MICFLMMIQHSPGIVLFSVPNFTIYYGVIYLGSRISRFVVSIIMNRSLHLGKLNSDLDE